MYIGYLTTNRSMVFFHHALLSVSECHYRNTIKKCNDFMLCSVESCVQRMTTVFVLSPSNQQILSRDKPGYINDCVVVAAFSFLVEFQRRGITRLKYGLAEGLPWERGLPH